MEKKPCKKAYERLCRLVYTEKQSYVCEKSIPADILIVYIHLY